MIGVSLSHSLDMYLRFCFFILCAFSIDGFAVEEPAGYRMQLYDDVVPDTLTGATRVTALEVQELQTTKNAVVVDVIPEHRRPDFLPEGQVWFPVSHKGIEGAVWLPDVGFGVLSEITEAYFVHHLKLVTGNSLDRPLVFYCRIDCWMSWNAAKRALSYGYRSVYWFADGLDDWRFEDLPMAILTPAPGQRQAAQSSVK